MPQVLADPVLLCTAFVNLIGNAVKFSREATEPRIEVEARTDARDVVLSVRDNGIGFPAEFAARLFEPFFRAPGASQEGHGLGVSLNGALLPAAARGRVPAEPSHA